MSQQQLARAVDLTFQQIQKYEGGANRISASRLYDFGRILAVPISYFFEGADDVVLAGVPGGVVGPSERKLDDVDPMMRRETLELVRAFYRIADPATRRRILDLAEAMAQKRTDELRR